VRVFGSLLRAFSYLFHGVLALFLLGLSVVTLATGLPILNLRMLPWHGDALTYWLLGLSLFALLSIALAVLGKTRWLFVLWTFAALFLMARGYFLTNYHFSGASQARGAAWLTVGALAAAAGSLMGTNEQKKSKAWHA
jgi:hypothetical protein